MFSTKKEPVLWAAEKLERVLAANVPGHERQWAKRVSRVLADVQQALQGNPVATKALDGVLAEVVPHSQATLPTTDRRVGKLHREHVACLKQVHILQLHLRNALQAFQPPPTEPDNSASPLPLPAIPDFGLIQHSAEHLLAALQHYQHEETKLVLETANTDVGVCD